MEFGNRFKDSTGERFGRLIALKPTTLRDHGNVLWECRCDCGRITFVRGDLLRSKNIHTFIRGCGCEWKKHGHSSSGGNNIPSGTYRSWYAMFFRCTNPKDPNYHNYGGRGIFVCERWKDFRNFLADMGERPQGKTLDRKENDGNYEPGNCRWATPREQAENKRKKLCKEDIAILSVCSFSHCA